MDDRRNPHRDEIDLVAFLSALWRFRFLIIAVTVVFGLAAVYYSLAATPRFEASVTVVRVADSGIGGAAALQSQLGGLASLAGIDLGQGGHGQEAQAVLKSRNLASHFIDRNGLTNVLAPDGGEPVTTWRAVRDFRERVLRIREDAGAGVTTISITWEDPELAAAWANGYVELANELIRTRAQEEAGRNIDYLNGQLDETNVVELERVLYNLIEAETKKLMLANARNEYAFMVVDPAVPPEVRSYPKRKLIVASGAAAGLFIGVLLVFGIDLIRRVRQEL